MTLPVSFMARQEAIAIPILHHPVEMIIVYLCSFRLADVSELSVTAVHPSCISHLSDVALQQPCRCAQKSQASFPSASSNDF